MPNHVINEIILHDTKLEDVRKYLFDKDEQFSFEVLLPLPLNYWAGSVSSAHEKAFPGTQLDAGRAIWGTKWDAYGNPTVEQVGDNVVIVFQSAWNHPRGWTCALFNTLRSRITASWLSEGGWNGHIETYDWGIGTPFGGPNWDDTEVPEGSDEHKRLHVLLWGVESFPDEKEDEEEGEEDDGQSESSAGEQPGSAG